MKVYCHHYLGEAPEMVSRKVDQDHSAVLLQTQSKVIALLIQLFEILFQQLRSSNGDTDHSVERAAFLMGTANEQMPA